jgi:hypothetical protein
MDLLVWLCLPSYGTNLLAVAAHGLHSNKECRSRGVCSGDGCGREQTHCVGDRPGRWHISNDVVVPDGLHIVFLPPYSPELQPAERLWSLSDEALANQHFSDLDALMEAQAERCRRLAQQPEVIRAHTSFHWWPGAAGSTSD